MARARVEFKIGSSSQTAGRPRFKKGEVKYLTSEADIKFFETDGDFKVVRLKDETPPKVAKVPPKTAKADDVVDDEDSVELPEWKPTDKKSILMIAATARDIAVTEDDTNADMVELLQAWDEDQQDQKDGAS